MSVTKRLGVDGIRMRLRSPRDEVVDRWLGIRTIGWRPAVGDEDDENRRVDYLPTSYSVLKRVLGRVDLGPDDVFVDLGAGLGRAVFVASWLGAGRATGVEIDPTLVAAANANLKRSRLRARSIAFVETGADRYSHIDTTVIYMYHPFGPATLREVTQRIEEGLESNPRRLRIAYLNPVHADVLDALAWLERCDVIGTERRAADPAQPVLDRGSSHAILWRSV